MPTATPFNNLITFSRGSNATVTGPNGLIQWAANNNATFSEQFDNAAWAKNSSSIAANVTTSPDGTRTADTWTPTSNGNTGAVRLLGTFTIPVGPNATTSIYVKSAGKRWVYLTTPAALSPLHNCWFDLQTGAVGTMGSGVLAATMTAVGDGWYRISTTSATTLATNYVFLSATDADNSTTVVADGTGVHIWGAQLEIGSTATTYNPTTVKNLLGFSEAFDNAAWVKSNSSIVTGAQANPINGLFNAQKLMENTANTAHRVQQTVNISGAPITLSAYLKAGERTWAYLRLDDASSVKFAYFNLATGAAGFTTSGVTSSITSVGSGWYRCSITFAAPAATAIGTGVIGSTTADATSSNLGDGNSGVYIYGAQLSDSASLDPYVPTPGAAPSSTAFYGPRFDFDPVTLQPRGILIEEQRANLLTYSERFDDAIWVKGSGGAGSVAVVTPNTATAPDGTLSADRLQLNAGGTALADFSFVQQSVTGLANPHSAARSVWMKSNTGLSYQIAIRELGANTFSVVTVGPNWSRFEYSTSGVAAVGDGLQIIVRGTYGTSTTADILVWGAQLEAGAFATSYIPTVASTVTRSADVATVSGSLFSQWYRQDEGAFVVDYDVVSTAAASKAFFATNDGTSNNTNYGYVFNTGVAFAEVRSGGATQAAFNLGPVTPNTTFKAALACKANDFAATSNGGAVSTDLSGAVALNQSELNIGHSRNYGGLYINGHIRNIRFIPARAADFQLQALST